MRRAAPLTNHDEVHDVKDDGPTEQAKEGTLRKPRQLTPGSKGLSKENQSKRGLKRRSNRTRSGHLDPIHFVFEKDSRTTTTKTTEKEEEDDDQNNEVKDEDYDDDVDDNENNDTKYDNNNEDEEKDEEDAQENEDDNEDHEDDGDDDDLSDLGAPIPKPK